MRKKGHSHPEDADEYVWGNHRGGGGAALVSARSGNQVTKLGQVLSGNKQIDGAKYNGVNGQERPKTSFDHRTPSAGSDQHDLFAPSQSVDSSPSMASRNEHRADMFESPTRQASRNSQRSGGMASLLSNAASYSSPPEPIKTTKLSRFEEEQQKKTKLSRFEEPDEIIRPKHSEQVLDREDEGVGMPRINGISNRQSRNMSSEAPPSPHLFSVPAQTKSSLPAAHLNPVIDISSILRGQQEILQEMRSMRDFSVKQAMLKSIRWGLGNIGIVDQCTCVGTLGGIALPPISLSDLIKKVLIEFMKCNGCNVGRRSIIGSKSEAESEKRFLEQLYDSIFLLTGAPPDMAQREDGDYEVFYGDGFA